MGQLSLPVHQCWMALLSHVGALTQCLRPQHEFPNVNPIIPSHYFYLAKRCFKALQENNGKVRKQLLLEGLHVLDTFTICLCNRLA